MNGRCFPRFKELGIRLRSYGVYEPSLNDIFVSAVGDEETPEDIKKKNNIGTSFSEFEPKQKKGSVWKERLRYMKKDWYNIKV